MCEPAGAKGASMHMLARKRTRYQRKNLSHARCRAHAAQHPLLATCNRHSQPSGAVLRQTSLIWLFAQPEQGNASLAGLPFRRSEIQSSRGEMGTPHLSLSQHTRWPRSTYIMQRWTAELVDPQDNKTALIESLVLIDASQMIVALE